MDGAFVTIEAKDGGVVFEVDWTLRVALLELEDELKAAGRPRSHTEHHSKFVTEPTTTDPANCARKLEGGTSRNLLLKRSGTVTRLRDSVRFEARHVLRGGLERGVSSVVFALGGVDGRIRTLSPACSDLR